MMHYSTSGQSLLKRKTFLRQSSDLRSSGKRRAQAMLEMAIVLPFLLVLVMLIIQYSLIMNAAVAVTNLSREGARFAATQTGSDKPIRDRVRSVCPPIIGASNLQDADIVITPTDVTARKPGSLISVAISYNMSRKLFLPATFFGYQIFAQNYTGQSTMMIE
jgi:Flp pilus assembly protein TadG